MNDKTKERIINIIIAVGIVSIVIVFPGSILGAVFPDTMYIIVQIALFILEKFDLADLQEMDSFGFSFEYDRRGYHGQIPLFFRIDSDNFLSFRVRAGF